MSPGQFFLRPIYCNGDESGVDGDEIKGVSVCKGLKLSVSTTSK